MKKFSSWVALLTGVGVLTLLLCLYQLMEPSGAFQATHELSSTAPFSVQSQPPPFRQDGLSQIVGTVYAKGQTEPIAGASIYYQPPRGTWQKLAAVSNEDGQFTIESEGTGVYAVFAQKDNSFSFPTTDAIPHILLQEHSQVPIRLEQAEGTTWHFRLRDSKTKKPIEDAEIRAPYLVGFNTFTRADGHAELSLPSDNWTLQVFASGYQPRVLSLGPARLGHASLECFLSPGAEARGTVLDTAGQPLPAVTLTLSQQGLSQRVSSDQLGQFRFKDLPPSGPVRVTLSKQGYLSKTFAEIDLSELTSNSLTATLPIDSGRAFSLEGDVTDLFNKPIPMARVNYLDKGEAQWLSTLSDPKGAFQLTLPPLEPDSLQYLLVQASGYAHRLIPFQSNAETQPLPLAAVLQPATALSGQVFDAQKQPVASAQVFAKIDLAGVRYTVHTLSDTTGHFYFEDISASEGLEVLAPGYQQQTLSPSSNQGSITVDLMERSWITGTLVDARTRAPISQFDLTLVDGHSSESEPSSPVHFANNKGQFWLPAVTPGPAKVLLEVPDSPPQWLTLQSGPLPSPRNLATIQVPRPEASLAGQVRYLDQPVADATVHACLFRSDVGFSFPWDAYYHKRPLPGLIYKVSTQTDNQGRFQFEGLPDTTWVLLVEKPGLAPTVETHVSTKTPVSLTLRQAGQLTCRFDPKHYQGVDLIQVRSLLPPLVQREVLMTPTSSEVVFDRLPYNEYAVVFISFDALGQRNLVENLFQSLDQPRMTLDLTKNPPAAVFGRITDRGRPLAQARVFLVPSLPGHQRQTTSTDSAGNYRFEAVPACDFELVCLGPQSYCPKDFPNILEAHPNRVHLQVLPAEDQRRDMALQPMQEVLGSAGPAAVDWEFTLIGKGKDGLGYARIALPDIDGGFHFAHIPEGTYQLRAWVNDKELLLKSAIRVRSDQPVLDLGSVSAQQPGHLKLILNGSNLVAGFVELKVFASEDEEDPDKGQPITTHTFSPDAGFTDLKGLASGPVLVEVLLHNDAIIAWPKQQICRILPDTTAELEVHLVPITRLEISFSGLYDAHSVLVLTHLQTRKQVQAVWRENLPSRVFDLEQTAYFNATHSSLQNLEAGDWQVVLTNTISGEAITARVHLEPGILSKLRLDPQLQ